MSDIFKIIPANAGAGKTYYLMDALTNWVKEKRVAPDRILAVTYTEAAARELRDRIRTNLLKEGMVDEALAIESAYITTIHGLGIRLLTEHSFAAGLSPQPRLLEDFERDLLIRKAISTSHELLPFSKELERFGYRFTPNGTAEDQFRNAVNKTIDQLRGLGTEGLRDDMAAKSVALLTEVYGDVLKDGSTIEDRLHILVEAMLEAFPHGIADLFSGNNSATREFTANIRALKKARDKSILRKDWRVWKELRSLRVCKRGAPTPEGYDELAEAVIAAADAVQKHPGPLRDACDHLSALIKGAQSIIEEYTNQKRIIGVLDYADMVADAEALLRENPAVLDAVLAGIDCVVVDEFQDTNPVQFAFLWRLAKRAKNTILVGDTKQSIMGFQGADVRLTEALMDVHKAAVEQLSFNWRSTPALVGFVNDFSRGMFGDVYHKVAPKREATDLGYLDIVKAPNLRSARSPKSRPYHNIAMRISEMLSGNELTTDRYTGKPRRIRPADIAVLCKTHTQMVNYADALRALGIPVQIESDGWFGSKAVQLARFAIAFAADPLDSYSALGLLTLGPEAMPLQLAMEHLKDGTIASLDALKPLLALTSKDATLPMSVFVAEVLLKSGLGQWAETQLNPRQLRADILRLEEEAAIFAQTDANIRSAAGFYGETANVFLGWLASRQGTRDADVHPNASSIEATGVELVTWFSAKGREWPVVVVVQFDEKISSRPGEISADFDGFTDLENVLGQARLSNFPYLDIEEKTNLFHIHARPEAERNARRLLYVALTRARDRVVLEWPEASIGKESKHGDRSFLDLFIAEADVELGDQEVIVGGEVHPARIFEGDVEISGEFYVPDEEVWPDFQRFGRAENIDDVAQTQWRQQPSSALGIAPKLDLVTTDFGLPVTDIGGEAANERGSSWHLALRAFLSKKDADISAVQSATGLPEATLMQLQKQALALEKWLTEQGYPILNLELPLQKRMASGSEINAIIDCLAEGPDGYTIVDHKSGLVPDADNKFAEYWPQLNAYRELVKELLPDKPVNAIAINWISEGRVSQCKSFVGD